MNTENILKQKQAELNDIPIYLDYKDKIEFEEIEEGLLKSTLLSGALTTTGPELLNEYEAVESGNIAITRICAEPVDFEPALNRKIDFVF